jgi:hypothetical protein
MKSIQVCIDFLFEVSEEYYYTHHKILVRNFCEGFFIDIKAKAQGNLDTWKLRFLHIFDELEHPQFEN